MVLVSIVGGLVMVPRIEETFESFDIIIIGYGGFCDFYQWKEV